MKLFMYYKKLYEEELAKEQEAFGKNVNIFCNTYNIRGFELAHMLGIAPEYLSVFKSGKRPVTGEVLEKFFNIIKKYNKGKVKV